MEALPHAPSSRAWGLAEASATPPGQPPPLREARDLLPPPPTLPNPRHGDRPAPRSPRMRLGVHRMHGRPICRVVGTAIERPLGGL